jgi:glycosyltransferase involved in cell wall biosynthesis
MKKVKVLLVTHLFSNHGSSSIKGGYYQIANYLGKYCQVDLLTCGERDKLIKGKIFNIIYKKTPKSDLFLQKRLALSYYAMKISKNYDLVHSLFDVCGFFPSFNHPIVLTEHVVKELDPNIWMVYKSFFQRVIYRNSKKVICVSRNLVKILKEKYKINSLFIPHGIDTKTYRPIKIDNRLRKKFLKNKYKYICVVCGMYAINKPVLYEIIDEFKSILFIRISKREKKKKLGNLIYFSEISEQEKIKLYNLADFVFKPVKFSTASNTILESMAMGKATITNKIGGITDYLDDSCGYLAPTVSDFPKIFMRVMNNKNEVKEKGKKAREKAVKNFSWEVVALRIIKIYQQVFKKTCENRSHYQYDGRSNC